MEITSQRQWKFLTDQLAMGQLAHAYLFSGQKETNKTLLIKEFVKYINCTGVSKPCHECNACQLIEKENYPDVRIVKTEPGKEEIEIKQMRDLQNFLSYKAYYGNYKAVIIEDAERMTFEAQNSFLKTLEEPKGKTVMFLLSSQPDRLLPTIFSRCQQVKFFYAGQYAIRKDEEKIMQDVAKIIVSDLAEKFQYAKRVNAEGDDFSRILAVCQKFFRQALHRRMGLGGSSLNEAYLSRYSIKKMQSILRLIESLNYQALTSSLNKKLALEILLIEL